MTTFLKIPDRIARFVPDFLKAGLSVQNMTMGRIMDTVASVERYHTPDLTKVSEQLKIYTEAPFVYIAVNAITRPAANIELEVFTVDGEQETPVDNHPIEQLFRKPNPTMSQFEFFKLALDYLQITGNAYWYLDTKQPDGQPAAIYLLRPDRIRIVPGNSQQQMIDGYVYTVQGMDIPLEREYVIHFRLPNPYDDFYGLSPLYPAMLAVQTDQAQAKWNFNFFGKRRAIPAAIVNVPSMIAKPDFEQLRNDWQREYGGNDRATAFIRGDDVKVSPLAMSQTDMDFHAARVFNKELVMLIYGVPSGVFDKNSTQATAETNERVLTEQTVWPLMQQLTQKITSELAPRYGDNLVVHPHDIRTKNAASERLDIQAASMYLTVNEIRQRYYGADPLPGGDIPAAGVMAVAATGGADSGKFDAVPTSKGPDLEIEAEKEGRDKATIEAPTKHILLMPSSKKAVDGPAAVPEELPVCLLLNLSNRPQLIAIQNSLKQRYPAVQWVDPNDFHITLVYASIGVELDYLYAALPRSINKTGGMVVGAGIFENGQERAFYLDVSPSLPLMYMQRSLYGLLEGMSTSISEFSQPEQWKAHITLGYVHEGAQVPQWDGAHFILESDQIDVSVKMGDGYVVPVSTKTLPDPEPVTYTRSIQREIRQFATYAAKGKPVDAFKWHTTPRGVQLALKSLADVDADYLAHLVEPHEATKARVSISGQADPLEALRVKFEKQLTGAFAEALQGAMDKVLGGVREVVGAAKSEGDDLEDYFDDDFFESITGDMESPLKAIIRQAVLESAKAMASDLRMSTGYNINAKGFNEAAARFADQWTDDVLKGFGTTTKEGIGALVSRWVKTPGSTVGDLVTAIKESHLFSEQRATLTAISEISRAFSTGTYTTASELADEIGIPMTFDADTLTDVEVPHPGCRCWCTPTIVYDGDKPVSMDMIWHTANDDRVCDVCAPRNGRYYSEIAAEM